MADKTFGVKVSEEMYDRAKMVIESSGVSAKDWFEKALALYELNSIKQGSSDYTQDLTELEHHTTRIYELIVNMIQRSVYLKDHAVKEVADKLESKETIITDLQQQNKNLKDELTQKNVETVNIAKQLKELEDKLEANQTTLENNQALISEYKEKNDVLNGLVAQYKAYGDENAELKRKLTDVESTLLLRATDAEQRAEVLTRLVEEKKIEAEKVKKQHEEDLQMAIERKELERIKATMEIERRYQAEIAELNTTHNEEIRSLYDEVAELRKVNDANREKYQAEIDANREKYQAEIDELKKQLDEREK